MRSSRLVALSMLLEIVLAISAPHPAKAGLKFVKQELQVPGGILWLTTGDLDGDGKIDLVLSYRRGAGPRSQRFIAVFFRGDNGFAARPDIAIAAPRQAAVFDVGDAAGDGRDQLVFLQPDGVWAQSFSGRKPSAPVRILTVPSLIGEAEEDDLINWDFLRPLAPGEPATLIIPTRGPLKLFRREESGWKLWSKVNLEQYSLYDAETTGFRRDRRGGASGRPYSFRATTIVPTLELVDQTGDGKPDLVTIFEDRVAVFPRLDDGTLSPRPSHTSWFEIRTPTELEQRDSGVSTQVLDLDGDGIADACVTKIAGGITTLASEVRFYRGLKGGGFEDRPAQVFKEEGFGALVQFLDVDGDGKLEMIHPHSEVSIMSITQMMLKREVSLGIRVRRMASERPLFFEKKEAQSLDSVFGLDLSIGAAMRGIFPIFGHDFDGDGVPDAILSDGGSKMVLHRGVRGKKELFEEEGHITLVAPGTNTTRVLAPSKKGGRPDVLVYYVDRSDLAGKIYVFKNEP